MLMALCSGIVLLFAGQTSTHTPQPVQSSGATWMVIRWRSLSRQLLVTNELGASLTAASGKAFMRMAACGQTRVHKPHSVQRLASQIGISAATLRFSKRAVPVGKTPVAGMAL